MPRTTRRAAPSRRCSPSSPRSAAFSRMSRTTPATAKGQPSPRLLSSMSTKPSRATDSTCTRASPSPPTMISAERDFAGTASVRPSRSRASACCGTDAGSYRVKKSSRRVSRCRIMTPASFLARLCALVPPPRYPLTRFHGVLAPRAKASHRAAAARERAARMRLGVVSASRPTRDAGPSRGAATSSRQDRAHHPGRGAGFRDDPRTPHRRGRRPHPERPVGQTPRSHRRRPPLRRHLGAQPMLPRPTSSACTMVQLHHELEADGARPRYPLAEPGVGYHPPHGRLKRFQGPKPQ